MVTTGIMYQGVVVKDALLPKHFPLSPYLLPPGTGTEMDPWTVITHETAQEKIGFGCHLTFLPFPL